MFRSVGCPCKLCVQLLGHLFNPKGKPLTVITLSLSYSCILVLTMWMRTMAQRRLSNKMEGVWS